jgi:hypothetical protein
MHSAIRRGLLKSLLAFVLAASLGNAAALAQSSQTTDKESDGSFTGIALITDNLSWYELFQRPEPPEISGKDQFGTGERGSLAIIFSNAQPREGTVRVECDIRAFDPNGSRTVIESGLCYEGPYAGDNILHPGLLDIQFEIGPNDPPGRAGFEITLRDANSPRSVTLTVEFTQGTGG